MKKTIIYFLLGLSVIILAAFYESKNVIKIKNPEVVADTLMMGLTVPWDICFLPSGEMIFTERSGQVRIYRDNKLVEKPLLTITDILVNGKMGLLSMCIHPDFIKNKFIYLAYNYEKNKQSYLRIARYKYLNDELVEPMVVIENIPAAHNHTGCRIKFGPDKMLMITTGDADDPRLAQDLKAYNGKILRLKDDGTIPNDNPFINNNTARHEIWSYGHRNSQGITFYPGSSRLFISEHGPTGGDEINEVIKGGNYGWPVVHHRERNKGMVSPLLEFSPSIAPADAIFYSGKAFSDLKGHLLVACLREENILNIKFIGNKISSYNFLFKNKYCRIRALTEGPDGFLYFSTSQVDPPESRLQTGEKGYDMIIRLRPSKINESKNKFVLKTSDQFTAAINKAPAQINKTPIRNSATLYAGLCASCHGNKMEGKLIFPGLINLKWRNSNARAALKSSITTGNISKGMPAWKGVLKPQEIENMANYIINKNKP